MRRSRRSDAGFTLLEVLMAMVVMGILLAIVAGPWSRYNDAHAEAGAERDLIAELRSVQQLAMTQNTTFRVTFYSQSAQIYRWDGTQYVAYRRIEPGSSKVHYSSPSFVGTAQTGASLYFLSNGTATPGSVLITRDGNTKTYEIDVDRLTARVYDGSSGD